MEDKTNSRKRTRRTVLKNSAATAALLSVGAVGSVAASEDETSEVGTQTHDVKDHYIRFEIDSGDGEGINWDCSVPDSDAELINGESGDSITRYQSSAFASGSLNGFRSPYYDEVRFNGSISEVTWSADYPARVIIDGDRKQ
jgi:hypothetical protein